MPTVRVVAGRFSRTLLLGARQPPSSAIATKAQEIRLTKSDRAVVDVSRINSLLLGLQAVDHHRTRFRHSDVERALLHNLDLHCSLLRNAGRFMRQRDERRL